MTDKSETQKLNFPKCPLTSGIFKMSPKTNEPSLNIEEQHKFLIEQRRFLAQFFEFPITTPDSELTPDFHDLTLLRKISVIRTKKGNDALENWIAEENINYFDFDNEEGREDKDNLIAKVNRWIENLEEEIDFMKGNEDSHNNEDLINKIENRDIIDPFPVSIIYEQPNEESEMSLINSRQISESKKGQASDKTVRLHKNNNLFVSATREVGSGHTSFIKKESDSMATISFKKENNKNYETKNINVDCLRNHIEGDESKDSSGPIFVNKNNSKNFQKTGIFNYENKKVIRDNFKCLDNSSHENDKHFDSGSELILSELYLDKQNSQPDHNQSQNTKDKKMLNLKTRTVNNYLKTDEDNIKLVTGQIKDEHEGVILGNNINVPRNYAHVKNQESFREFEALKLIEQNNISTCLPVSVASSLTLNNDLIETVLKELISNQIEQIETTIEKIPKLNSTKVILGNRIITNFSTLSHSKMLKKQTASLKLLDLETDQINPNETPRKISVDSIEKNLIILGTLSNEKEPFLLDTYKSESPEPLTPMSIPLMGFEEYGSTNTKKTNNILVQNIQEKQTSNILFKKPFFGNQPTSNQKVSRKIVDQCFPSEASIEKPKFNDRSCKTVLFYNGRSLKEEVSEWQRVLFELAIILNLFLFLFFGHEFYSS